MGNRRNPQLVDADARSNFLVGVIGAQYKRCGILPPERASSGRGPMAAKLRPRFTFLQGRTPLDRKRQLTPKAL
jgi:hypothetical protein